MESKNELKVIGAGFGRTGTTSLAKALEILGVGPCYHLNEIIDRPDKEVEVCTFQAKCMTNADEPWPMPNEF